MRGFLCLAVVTVVVVNVHGWGRILADNGLGYNSWIPSRRSWGCGRDRDVCYQTSQCCRGFYCQRIDPNDSTVPGLCRAWRQEKQWTCLTDADCNKGQTCTKEGPNSVQLGKCAAEKPRAQRGESCLETSDCAQGLCCQIIRTFRSGPLRMCSRVTPFSKCIKAEKGIGEE